MADADLGPFTVKGRWHHGLPDGRVQCDLCPRHCRLRDGQRAFCFVRQRVGADVVLTSYGRATGFCIDPIEKKPLNHFYPGTSVLSFGTAGCNLGCRFCQNWDISKAREIERLTDAASPERIAAAAVDAGCRSVAFTYNDPVLFAEYAIDAARACRDRGVRAVAVTAGYVTASARADLFSVMDAVNVDLKSFSESFYEKICAGSLAPVLDTLRFLAHDCPAWLEVTTLLIPDQNDGDDEIGRLSDWFAETLGPDVPLHFTAFHPDYRMTDIPRTPAATLRRARARALAAGLRYVYIGNVSDPEGQSTSCSGCGARVIARDGYRIDAYRLDGGRCASCGARVAGVFDERGPGQWGPRRLRVQIA